MSYPSLVNNNDHLFVEDTIDIQVWFVADLIPKLFAAAVVAAVAAVVVMVAVEQLHL